jgi:hypothetical protein
MLSHEAQVCHWSYFGVLFFSQSVSKTNSNTSQKSTLRTAQHGAQLPRSISKHRMKFKLHAPIQTAY